MPKQVSGQQRVPRPSGAALQYHFREQGSLLGQDRRAHRSAGFTAPKSLSVALATAVTGLSRPPLLPRSPKIPFQPAAPFQQHIRLPGKCSRPLGLLGERVEG